jgi:hypothetical protein
MLKPFEIDLLRQDLQAALRILGQDEIDDAHALMREHGFQSADFEIIPHADPSPAHPSGITGKVTLIQRKTRLSKSYKAGSGSSWLTEFGVDLASGAFGRGIR